MEPKVILNGKKRVGKGFSHLELKKAKLDLKAKKKYNLRIDKRRKTAYDENVNLLKVMVAEEKRRKEEAKKAKMKGKKKKSTEEKKAKPKEPVKKEKEPAKEKLKEPVKKEEPAEDKKQGKPKEKSAKEEK